jgi:hypothetical protein
MLTYSLASYTSLHPCQPDTSGIPTEAKFKFHYFPGGWVGGLVGGVKLKVKLNSAQLKLELRLSLATFQNLNNDCITRKWVGVDITTSLSCNKHEKIVNAEK